MIFNTGAGSCPYPQLQILLPGESPAPGTDQGKTGTPVLQITGVPFEVIVRACDGEWNTVAGVNHVIRITSTDPNAVLPPSRPLISGELRALVTLNSSGIFTFTAEDLTDREHFSATSSPVEAASGTGDAAALEISQIYADQYAGAPFDLEIRAVDAGGNTDTGFSSVIELSELTSIGNGRMSPDTIELQGGFWSGAVTLFLADENSSECAGGSVKISAVAIVDRTINGTSGCFSVHPGEMARVQLLVPGQAQAPSTLAGLSGSPATQTAGYGFRVYGYATDEFWNQVESSDEIMVTSTDPGVPVPFTGSFAGGAIEFNMTFMTAGNRTLTVSDLTDCDIIGMTTEVVPVISNEPTFVIEPVTGPVTAGIPVMAGVNVIDNEGNPLTDYNGYAMLAANTGPGSISPETIKFTSGAWRGEVTFFGAGEDILFSCIDYSIPPNIGTSSTIEVFPGEYVALQVVMPGQTPQGGMDPGLYGMPDWQDAGGSFDIMIVAIDRWSNRVPDVNDRVRVISSDAYAEIAPETQLSNGTALLSATFYAAGEHNIFANDIDIEETTVFKSDDFTILPGPFSKIIMIAPGEELVPGSERGKAGTPTDQTINHTFTVKILATDQWWNPVGEANDDIEFVSTDQLGEIISGGFLVDGVLEVSVNLSTGGYQLITASNISDPSMEEAVSQVRMINSGFHYEVEIDRDQVVAGESFTLSVKVTNDAGAVMQEVNSFARVEVLNAENGNPGGGVLLSPSFQLLQGIRSIRQTYTKAEPIILVIRDDEGSAPGMTGVVAVAPAPPDRMAVESDLPWIGGRKSMIVRASVLDEFGNGIPDQPVEFELAGGAGSIMPIDEFTDGAGIARAEFFSPYEAEIGMVRVKSNELAASLQIETALVDPSSPGGSVTNYPNPFHPDEGNTTIAYNLSDDASVTMKLFTLSGKLVFRKSIAQGDAGGLAGLNEIEWDGKNGNGAMVASGGYLLVIEAVRSGETIHSMRRRVGVIR